MTKNVYAVGFLTFIAVMTAFFITNIFFRDVNYYRTSISLSAFLVPFLMAIGAFVSVIAYSKFKKVLSFKEAFGRAFLPMFVGAFLSISSIFVYISYIDKDTKDLLNYQYIESFKTSLEEEYGKAKLMIKPESAEWKEKLDKEEKITLNQTKFFALMKERKSQIDRFKALEKMNNKLTFILHPEESARLKNDEAFSKKTENWKKNLQRDFYLQESVNIISEMGGNAPAYTKK